MKKTLIVIFAIIFIAILSKFALAWIFSEIKNKNFAKYTPPDVTVTEVTTKKIKKTFEAPGRVEARYQVNVVARISGYLLKSYFKEGSDVKSGDVLFLIEPDEYKNNVSVAGADVKRIAAQLDYANKQLLRAKELVKQDYIAKSRYDEILSNRNALQAELTAANSSLRDAKRNLGYTTIKSPIDGRIGVIALTVGNYVTVSSQPLTTIYSINPIYVTFPLSSEDYNELTNIDKNNNKNRKVELFFDNGTKYDLTGIQDFLDNKVQETTGTVTFRATFQNPNKKLLHGEFVRVKIYANNEADVPIVPVVAVSDNQQGKYVYKLDENNLPQMVYITTDGQIGDYWIIKSGLKAGDKVVSSGLLKITPNKPINIISNSK